MFPVCQNLFQNEIDRHDAKATRESYFKIPISGDPGGLKSLSVFSGLLKKSKKNIRIRHSGESRNPASTDFIHSNILDPGFRRGDEKFFSNLSGVLGYFNMASIVHA